MDNVFENYLRSNNFIEATCHLIDIKNKLLTGTTFLKYNKFKSVVSKPGFKTEKEQQYINDRQKLIDRINLMTEFFKLCNNGANDVQLKMVGEQFLQSLQD